MKPITLQISVTLDEDVLAELIKRAVTVPWELTRSQKPGSKHLNTPSSVAKSRPKTGDC